MDGVADLDVDADADADKDGDTDADAESDDIPSRLPPPIPLLIDIGDTTDCESVLIPKNCDDDADDADDDDGFICDDRLCSVEKSKLDVDAGADADADADADNDVDPDASLVLVLISFFLQRPNRWHTGEYVLVPFL